MPQFYTKKLYLMQEVSKKKQTSVKFPALRE